MYRKLQWVKTDPCSRIAHSLVERTPARYVDSYSVGVRAKGAKRAAQGVVRGVKEGFLEKAELELSLKE